MHPSHASEISGTLSLVNTAVNFALPSSLHLVGQVANVIFLESPSNVGFSYCGAKPTGEHEGQQTAPCSWTDTSTAKLNYDALQAFYAKFPEYQTNPFYIWGELCRSALLAFGGTKRAKRIASRWHVPRQARDTPEQN